MLQTHFFVVKSATFFVPEAFALALVSALDTRSRSLYASCILSFISTSQGGLLPPSNLQQSVTPAPAPLVSFVPVNHIILFLFITMSVQYMGVSSHVWLLSPRHVAGATEELQFSFYFI